MAEARCVIEQNISGTQTTLYPETKAEYVNGLDSKIDTKTAALNTKLTGDINTVNTNLTNSINTTNSTLTTKINTVDSRVTATNTEVAKKASQAQLDASIATINTTTTGIDNRLAAVEAGGTAQSDEVVGIRAGADGVNYQSAGQAVQSQFQKKASFGNVKEVPALQTPAQQWISDINAAGTQAKSDMDAKATATIASIPDDYTTLSNEVTGLKSDLSQISEKFRRINIFDNTDITLNQIPVSTLNSSTLTDMMSQNNTFTANQIWRVKKNDIVRCNVQWVGFNIYNSDGILVEKYNRVETEFVVTNDDAYYLRMFYGAYSDTKINFFMLTINHELPPDVYVPFEKYSVDAVEIDEIKKIKDNLRYYEINTFNKEDITLNKYPNTTNRALMTDLRDGDNNFIANKIWEVKDGDIVYTNVSWVGFVFYDYMHRLIQTISVVDKQIPVPEGARFMRVFYARYNDGYINSMMISINHPLPNGYVESGLYNIECYITKTYDFKQSYILFCFDNPKDDEFFTTRFNYMKEYGYPFTFAFNSRIRDTNGFATETAKQNYYDMIAYGCDVAIYGGIGANPTPSTASVDDWKNYVNTWKSWCDEHGIYSSVYFASHNDMPANAVTAIKAAGFEWARTIPYWNNNKNDIDADENTFLISCHGLYNSESMDDMKAKVLNCISKGTSISFIMHDIGSETEYNITEEKFYEFMNWIEPYVNNGSIIPVTYQEYFNRVTNKGRSVNRTQDIKKQNFILRNSNIDIW